MPRVARSATPIRGLPTIRGRKRSFGPMWFSRELAAAAGEATQAGSNEREDECEDECAGQPPTPGFGDGGRRRGSTARTQAPRAIRFRTRPRLSRADVLRRRELRTDYDDSKRPSPGDARADRACRSRWLASASRVSRPGSRRRRAGRAPGCRRARRAAARPVGHSRSRKRLIWSKSVSSASLVSSFAGSRGLLPLASTCRAPCPTCARYSRAWSVVISSGTPSRLMRAPGEDLGKPRRLVPHRTARAGAASACRRI